MALSTAVKAKLFRTMYALHVQGEMTDRQVVERTWEKHGIDSASDRAASWTVLRQAKQAAEAGRELESEPSAAIPRGSHALDPTLSDLPGQYGYRVKVTFRTGNGNETADTVVIVTSDRPLSVHEIQSEAEGEVAQFLRRGSSTNPGEKGNNWTLISVQVISAGRK